MSKKREQSAIDSIYSMENTLEELLKRIQVIEDNLKLLNNKVSKLSKAPKPNPLPLDKVEHRPDPVPRQQKVEKLVLGNIKLHGYIVNKAKRPLVGVAVNIYDSNSKLIKNVSTDNDGHWEVRLPSGKYGVEYIHNKFKPVNRTIELEDGTKEYEVR